MWWNVFTNTRTRYWLGEVRRLVKKRPNVNFQKMHHQPPFQLFTPLVVSLMRTKLCNVAKSLHSPTVTPEVVNFPPQQCSQLHPDRIQIAQYCFSIGRWRKNALEGMQSHAKKSKVCFFSMNLGPGALRTTCLVEASHEEYMLSKMLTGHKFSS